MARFTDAKGKDWVISITVNTIRKVKAKTGEDLSRAVEGDFLKRIGGDACLLGSILWALVEDKAEGLTEDEFYDALAGDALEAAASAFVEALIDFFPQPRRSLLLKAHTAGKKAQEKAMEIATQQMDEVLADLSGKSSTNSPEFLG